jgi:GNAT superfamily N-acetyltransferase
MTSNSCSGRSSSSDWVSRTTRLRLELLAKTEEEFSFSLNVRNAAMRPHLENKWVWNDSWQERLHRSRFEAQPIRAIVIDDQRIGTICIESLPQYAWLSEFYILPALQKQGLGSLVLREVCAGADGEGRCLRLQHLLWNPAASLYRRFGFREICRTELNAVMERAPSGPIGR